MLGCLSVGLGDCFVKVCGYDTCVNVIGQCGVIWFMFGEDVGEGDEACVSEGGVHVGGRGLLGEAIG